MHRSRSVNSGSRRRRLAWVTRRLRVMMLKANCSGSWPVYWPRFSNHSRLACAARWVDATTGRRSASYAARAAGMRPSEAWPPVLSCRQAASASASSMASLVPEPMEKCAVWAASPSSTTFPSCQLAHRNVAKLSQRELLARRARPPSTPSKSPATRRDRGLVRLARRQVPGCRCQFAEAGRLPDRLVHLDDERAAAPRRRGSRAPA